MDYTIESGSPPVIEEQMRYLAGFGVHAVGSAGVPPASGPVFLHGDLTRSTMMTTDTSATVVGRVAYTAFGDPVVWDEGSESWRVGWPVDLGTRYQYDGGWGYESGLVTLWGEDTTLPPLTLQHVGWRWYQPGIGRFIQRDPIGLRGGLNVYRYCEAGPVTWTDPLGLAGSPYFEWNWGHFGLAVGVGASGGAAAGGLAGPVPAAAGAATGAVRGAGGYLGAWTICIVVDIVSTADDYWDQEEKNKKDRQKRPDVFPPPAPRPPRPPVEPPCGLHY